MLSKDSVPTAPNDKVIHVSQCKNDMCPLKEVLKITMSNKNTHAANLD